MIELSKAQQEAVDTIYGQVILVSCPGSGKTSTVVRRVANMVEKGIDAGSILVLTFSKAAALEMKERYLKISDSTEKNRTVFATIHSFCYNVIVPEYGLTADDILKETDAWMLIRSGIDDLRKSGELTMEIRDISKFVTQCLREISVINNNGVDWNTYEADTCSTNDFRKLYNLYEQKKRSLGKIDFDDMLRMCHTLFCEQPDILKRWQSRFHFLIIDEFQDTNFLQAGILYMLAGDPDHANICVVGDDDQSIYRFRGARPEIMLNFKRQYPKCKEIYMDVNYRSLPKIIEQAKRLIERNTMRFKKDIKASREGTGEVYTFTAAGAENEVYTLIERILAMNETGVPYDDMAVLFRENKQAVFLSMVLLANNIPFHSNDKLESPYRHWIFHDLMAFWRLANGTGNYRDLISVINKPNRYVPVQCLKDVSAKREAVKRACYQNVKVSADDYWKVSKMLDAVDDFFFNLSFMKAKDPETFIKLVRNNFGYDTYLVSYAKYRNMDVKELSAILDTYENDIKKKGIQTEEEWIRHAETINRKIDQINRDRSKKGVTISTMHKSKGLEWPVVFIIGANEGICPSMHSKDSLEGLEEERRLFYVAVTRAKNTLIISSSLGLDSESGVSRFVSEMLNAVKQGTDENAEPENAKKYRRFHKDDIVVHPTRGTGTVQSATKQDIVVLFDAGGIVRFRGDETNILYLKHRSK